MYLQFISVTRSRSERDAAPLISCLAGSTRYKGRRHFTFTDIELQVHHDSLSGKLITSFQEVGFLLRNGKYPHFSYPSCCRHVLQLLLSERKGAARRWVDCVLRCAGAP